MRDDLEFNLAYIPAEFDVESDEEFDVEYMRALFDYGYRLMINGYDWHRQPPNFRRETVPTDTPSQGSRD